ncbi:MAG TPA: hypothetical protein P5567_09315 [Kiritimatiellia bacterium]|nr:hypothetical protein [Kiritimatiellia bacterium]HRZ12639.1 hypothetical protein [Kiritimatiellia bacterium]HSA19593.1 hypothetical protein [Kiritimatiellia bacterium]
MRTKKRNPFLLHPSSLILLLCSSFILDPSSFSFAQSGAPAVINYQGRLYDPSLGGTGGPLTGVQQIEFRIYDNITGGTLIWGRQFPVSCTDQGVFNVLLNDGGTWLAGATNHLPSVFLGSDRFLELTVVGHGSAISPRQQLVSAPYALQAAHAADALAAGSGFTVNGGVLAVNGLLNMSGLATLNSGLVVRGSTALAGTLGVGGATVVSNTLHVTGNFDVAAPSTIAGFGSIPIGGIIMWSGAPAGIPSGWALCDGGTHEGVPTPDLRNRFVVGAGGAYAVSSTGGVDTVTLDQQQIPSHTHPVYAPNNDVNGSTSQGWPANNNHQSFRSSDRGREYTINSAAVGSIGGGQAHENRPPYYALCYIMRVK